MHKRLIFVFVKSPAFGRGPRITLYSTTYSIYISSLYGSKIHNPPDRFSNPKNTRKQEECQPRKRWRWKDLVESCPNVWFRFGVICRLPWL